ncbi:MAG TPA: IS91 family transposase [Anaeromyxobacteraceae bacterium]|nr:IS91 family transposase [Anaeromyxobacteraceae bacterium]
MGAIARAHGEAFKKRHALTEAQRKVLRAVSACRTEVLGGRVDVCARCGDEKVVFHSCRNRHCPQCQAVAQARWLEGRLARLLPVAYFHVVFTVPDDLLAGLALRNREVFFDAMFQAGSQTLLALGEDGKRLGGQIGLTAVLHTWTRDLRFHPHLHCIVTGGGLTRDGTRWKATRQDYLFPVRVLSALFRGKLLAALDESYKDGRLEVRGVEGLGDAADPDTAWRRLRRRLYRTKWVSYAKPPFAGPESVYQYLGRYTHRVGLSNRRLVSATDEAVTFRTWGEQTATLHPHEFLRRFLLHVLPDGFVKMRHYGLLAPGNVTTRLATACALLQARRPTPAPDPATTPPTEQPQVLSWRELLLRLTGLDVTRCRKCGGAIFSRPLGPVRPKDTS